MSEGKSSAGGCSAPRQAGPFIYDPPPPSLMMCIGKHKEESAINGRHRFVWSPGDMTWCLKRDAMGSTCLGAGARNCLSVSYCTRCRITTARCIWQFWGAYRLFSLYFKNLF